MVDDPRNLHRETLANGVAVLTERMEHLRSASIGIWLRTGSRHEEPTANGISHFLEHMVFKGTQTRSAADIARQVDSIGGNMDAFTAKEYICFNIKVLDEHLAVALDLLSDLVLNPIFDPQEIDREIGVILEELKMDEDNPDYLVSEIFTQNFWKGHALGKPIAGTKDTVRRFDRDLLQNYYQHHIQPGNLIIAAAGNLDHQRFAELVNEKFHLLKPGKNGWHDAPPKVSPRVILKNKKALEQVQICLGVPSHPVAHEARYVSYALNTLLGGGMSSRLFQNIRERQGLAYAIFSDLVPFRDAGCLSVFAGTSKESAARLVHSVISEFQSFKKAPVSAEELRRAKDQLKGNLMLSLESSTARMSSLARQEMYFDHFATLDEIIEKIEEVTPEQIRQLANEYFQSDRIAVTFLGNLNGVKFSRDELVC